MPAVGSAVIIKKFLEDGPLGRKVMMPEMKEFMASTTTDEKQQMGRDAASLMGYTEQSDGKFLKPESE